MKNRNIVPARSKTLKHKDYTQHRAMDCQRHNKHQHKESVVAEFVCDAKFATK